MHGPLARRRRRCRSDCPNSGAQSPADRLHLAAAAAHICTGTWIALVCTCAGTGLAPAHICTGTWIALVCTCAGTGLAPAHICTGTEPTYVVSTLGLVCPHPARCLVSPLPHLCRDSEPVPPHCMFHQIAVACALVMAAMRYVLHLTCCMLHLVRRQAYVPQRLLRCTCFAAPPCLTADLAEQCGGLVTTVRRRPLSDARRTTHRATWMADNHATWLADNPECHLAGNHATSLGTGNNHATWSTVTRRETPVGTQRS